MHLEHKKISEYPFYLRWLYRSQKRKLGEVLLPGLFWGIIPKLQVLFLIFWKHLDRKASSLAPSLRSLVQVRVAQMNDCAFCIDYNSLKLVQRTNSMDKVENLDKWRTYPHFSELEKAALEYTDIICGPHVKVPGELMDRLKKNLTRDQIVELTALIAFQNMSAKFNAALDIPSQGMCKIPKP